MSNLDDALGSTHDPVAAVSRVLRGALHRVEDTNRADQVLDALVSGWRRWIDEADYVGVQTWPIYRDFGVTLALRAEQAHLGELRTAEGRTALADVSGAVERGSQHRSDVSQLLAEARAGARTSGRAEVSRDIDRIDRWYSRGRYRALSEQHGCAGAQAVQRDLPPAGLADELVRQDADAGLRRIEVPDDVLSRLSAMDDAEFAALVTSQERHPRAWWTTEMPTLWSAWWMRSSAPPAGTASGPRPA